MSTLKIGQYQTDICDGGIFFPKKLEMCGKEVRIIYIRDFDLTFLQVWEDMKENPGEKDGIMVLKKYTAFCRQDGYLELPEEFLARRQEDDTILILGMKDHLELYFTRQIEKELQTLDPQLLFSVFNVPGEVPAEEDN